MSVPALPRRKASVSVIIPCEPDDLPRGACRSLLALPAPDRAHLLEVHLAYGRNPARQRNLAARRAKGDWLLFLDKDSLVAPGTIGALLQAAAPAFVAAAGGPDLPRLDESPLGLRFDRVQASWFGSMRSRSRYCRVGAPRLCSDRELILCNLLVRRSAFEQAGGFREDLYPNEENELLARLSALGWRLAYDPRAPVRRRRPNSVAAFTAQAFAYGKGRARQVRVSGLGPSLPNLMPLALPVAWFLCFVASLGGAGVCLIAWIPAFYLGACLLAARLRPTTALLFAMRHHAYAAGLLVGFLGSAPPRLPEVRLQKAGLARLRAIAAS